MELSPSNLNALRTKYSQIFQSTFLEQLVVWQKVAQLITSTAESETHVWVDRIPQVRQWVGDRVIRNASLREYILPNLPFEQTEGLDQFKVEDNKINAFEPVVRMQASAAKKWPDNLIFDNTAGILALGATSAAVTYDNQPYFSQAHPQNMDNPNSVTQSNYFPTGYPLTHENYSSVRSNMRGLKGADGKPLLVNPNLLIVGPENEQQAKQILQAEWVSPTANTGAVAAGAPSENVLRGTADPLVVDDMSGNGGQWYLADYKKPVKPLIFQLREAAKFVMRVKPDDAPVFSRHEYQYGVYMRGNAGYGPWFLMAAAHP
jgi:phage major head subunit gpT-like protein